MKNDVTTIPLSRDAEGRRSGARLLQPITAKPRSKICSHRTAVFLRNSRIHAAAVVSHLQITN